MRRLVLSLSGFLLGLWVVLVSTFLPLLFANAPSVPEHTPFASVYINAGDNDTIYLPNPIFDCKEIGQQFQCQAEIQAHWLNLSFTKDSDYKYDLSNCRAWYDGRSIGCQEIGANHAPLLSEIYEITNLGLRPQQLQAIQQKYWGINVFLKLGENGLFLINDGLSLMVAISLAFFSWFYPDKFSKAFAIFACEFSLFGLVYSLLSFVKCNTAMYSKCDTELWHWFVTGTSLTLLTTVFLLWSHTNRFVKILLCLVSSLGAIALLKFGFLSILLDLGYAD